ncbi:hypothetical protein J5I95_13780 [Candidatus Poribacteria bacterium]|nr:hypothetical protein [Candidatus Poribacteria bacterium]
MEYVIIHGTDHTGEDTFMCLSGERIETETDTSVYPFQHAVTLKLSADSAARIGQDTITVSESEILQNCELPKATDLPAETQQATPKGVSPKQLTLFGDTSPDQLSLFE